MRIRKQTQSVCPARFHNRSGLESDTVAPNITSFFPLSSKLQENQRKPVILQTNLKTDHLTNHERRIFKFLREFKNDPSRNEIKDRKLNHFRSNAFILYQRRSMVLSISPADL